MYEVEGGVRYLIQLHHPEESLWKEMELRRPHPSDVSRALLLNTGALQRRLLAASALLQSLPATPAGTAHQCFP